MTTMAKKVATHVLDVRAVDLHRILSNAVLFASTDDTLPMANMVRIETTADRMVAVAVTMQTIAVSWVNLDGTAGTAHDDDGCAFNLSRVDAVALIKASKTPVRRHGNRFVRLIQNYDGTMDFSFYDGTPPITVTHCDKQFPKWAGLFPKTELVPRNAFGFTLDYFALFGQVDAGGYGHHLITVFSFDGTHDNDQKKPFVVRIGSQFVGLVMPVRLNGLAVWDRPEWL